MAIIKVGTNAITAVPSSAITALPTALTIVREVCKEVSWH